MKTPLLALVALGFVSIFAPRVDAQTPVSPPAQVEVSQVKFAAARLGSDNWLESEIRLDVKPGGKLVSGEFVNRVKVILSIACDATDNKGKKSLTYYRSQLELISLEGGKPAYVRFYLPPEVVKRDNLRADVKYYMVELEAAGEPQKPIKTSASNDFTTAESLKNFLNKVSAESGVNEGILMPQYLTPFASDIQRPYATALRREVQR
ncbi:MAG: hypothetical protein RL376_740 [Verrucomicrobiota bacterium]|jgi:hypothetical protein